MTVMCGIQFGDLRAAVHEALKNRSKPDGQATKGPQVPDVQSAWEVS